MIGGTFHKKVGALPDEHVLKRSGSVLARATGETSFRGILCLTNFRLLWLPQVFLGRLVEPLAIPLSSVKSCSVGRVSFLSVPLEISAGDRTYTIWPSDSNPLRWWRFGRRMAEEWRDAIVEATGLSSQAPDI